MADIKLSQSTDYEIQQLTLTTNFGQVDISGMMLELNLFDSILQPCLSGNMMIQDAVGLASKLAFDGSEFLTVQMSKTGDLLPFFKYYHVYKLSDRKITGLNNETYVLHFASEEMALSDQQKIDIGFQDRHSEVVRSVLEDYLQIPDDKKNGALEESSGSNAVNPPYLSPFDTAMWCAKRALNDNGIPNFFFFENVDGYNFVSTSSMFKNASLFTVDFSVRNTSLDNDTMNLFTARAFEVISQYDFLKNTQSGVYAGTFVGYDVLTRRVLEKKIDFSQIYGEDTHANEHKLGTNYVNRQSTAATEMFDAKRVVFPYSISRVNTPWLKMTDNGEANLKDNPEKWMFQREAVVQNLMSRRVRVVLPGNFQLSSGYCLNMNVPIRGQKSETDNDDNTDVSLNGKYLIISTRHVIRYDKHETILELVTDSSPTKSLAEETDIASQEPSSDSIEPTE